MSTRVRPPRRNGSLACALLLLIHGAEAAEAQTYKGRKVSEMLQRLEDESLRFLYSSDLVPDSLTVGGEPRTRDRLGIAREILAEHDLIIQSVDPALFIVIRRTDGDRSRTLEGKVVDAKSGAALSGARVELHPLGRVTWSDGSGRFFFDRLAAGEEYRLLATIEDYAHGELPLQIHSTDDASTGTTLRLQRVALDTVVVEASRYELASEAASGVQRLDTVELANQPNVAEDPIRALGRLPGVVQGGLSAASNLRGGETSEVLVLVDGFPLRQPFHLPGYQSPVSLLEEDLIDKIDVFTGGFPARYGNRLSGVFDIESTAAGTTPKTAVGLSFINAHARSAGESSDGTRSWRGSARHGTLRPMLRYFSVDAGQPGFSDLWLMGTQRPRENLELGANVLWATDEYTVDDDDERAEISSRTRYSWLSAEYAPADTLSGKLWLGHSRIEIGRVGEVAKPEFAVGNVSDHRTASLWDARATLDWRWSNYSRLNSGFEWTSGDASYRYDSAVWYPEALSALFDREPGFERSLRANPRQRRFAVFASQRWQLGERWMPEIGLRMQDMHVDTVRQRTWDPRLGVRFAVHPRTSLRAHWGRFHQADEVHELRIADGVSEFARAQSSEHWILGLEHRFTNGVQLRTEVFRKQLRHPRQRFENLLSPIEVFAEIAPDRTSVAPDAAKMRGFEFSLALEREAWGAWSAISVARAQDELGPDQVPRSWDQRLSWMTGVDWHRGHWRAGAAATMRSGWPITPVIDTGDGALALGARNSDRLPAFATLDVRLEYRRPLAVGSLAVALDISNLTNRRNHCCMDVEVEDIGTPEEAMVVEDQFWPGLLPSLRIEWSR
jgi:outer membrane cobalamin receptor